MASRVHSIQNNFNGGEISPLALGRTDLDKYGSMCESLQNYIALLSGGVVRRPGTRYVAAAMGPSRLIPFKFSLDQAYILEFGDQRLRFYTLNGQIQSGGAPYEIFTPYNTATDDLWDIKFAQTGDMMYLVHPNHAVQHLNRIADDDWRLSPPNFRCPPTHAFDQDVSGGTITLTPAATTGSGITFTASATVFLDGDIGKAIVFQDGLGFITAQTGNTATVDIIDNFPNTTAIPAGSWFLRGPPQSYACYGQVDAGPAFGCTKKLGAGQIQNLFTFSTFITQGDDPSGKFQDTFRPIDVGRFVVIGGSEGQILTYVSAHEVSVRLFSPITATFVAPTNGTIRMQPISGGAWTIEDPAFTTKHGFPRAICFFQDRLTFAGTADQPQTVWASVTGDYENFSKGAQDDQSIEVTVNSGFREEIQWLEPFQGQIACGTRESEIMISGGNVAPGSSGNAITPTDVADSIQSRYGVSSIQALIIGSDLFYVQRKRQTAYVFNYDIQETVYSSDNLNILSDLITTSGFKEMVYAPQPYRVVWFTDMAGNLLGLTYSREQKVFGWHRHFTGQDEATPDQVISVSSIPNPDGLSDQVWLLTGRQGTTGANIGFASSGAIDIAQPPVPNITEAAPYAFKSTGTPGPFGTPTLPVEITVTNPGSGALWVAVVEVQGYSPGVGAHLNPIDVPAGWTLHTNVITSGSVTILYRITDGSEGPSTKFSYAGPAFNYAGFAMNGFIVPIDGADLANPFDGISITGNVANGSCFSNSLTTTTPNDLLIIMMQPAGSNVAITPADITGTVRQIRDVNPPGPIQQTLAVWAKGFAGPGATGQFFSSTGWPLVQATQAVIAISPGTRQSGAIYGFPTAASGAIAPAPVISGPSTHLATPLGLFIGADGKLWIADSAANTGQGAIIGYTHPEMDAGNTPPDVYITGAFRSSIAAPQDVFVTLGKIYVANSGGAGILIFNSTDNGDASPIGSISGATTTLVKPIGVAVDATGNVYVIDEGVNSVLVWDAGNVGNVAPDRTITGAATLLHNPLAIRFAPNGTLWVTNGGTSNGVLVQFLATDSGNATPQSSIATGDLVANQDTGIAFDVEGNLFVTGNSGNQMLKFAGAVTGTPIAITGFPNGPLGVAIGPNTFPPSAGRFFIEFMDPTLYEDAASSLSSVSDVTSVSGFDYLAGRQVNGQVDGKAVGLYTVPTSGVVDFSDVQPTGALEVQLGLPFYSLLQTVRLELQAQGQTVQGIFKRWAQVWIRVYQTIGARINGENVQFRSPNDPMDAQVPAFTGDKRVALTGFDREGRLTIEQRQPLPSTLLASFGQVDIGDN